MRDDGVIVVVRVWLLVLVVLVLSLLRMPVVSRMLYPAFSNTGLHHHI